MEVDKLKDTANNEVIGRNLEWPATYTEWKKAEQQNRHIKLNSRIELEYHARNGKIKLREGHSYRKTPLYIKCSDENRLKINNL